MSEQRLIRLSSRALGCTSRVRVYIYGTVEEMREAGTRFNGCDFSDAAALTQAYYDAPHTHCLPIVRLARGQLDVRIVSHEMHHASAALYAVRLAPDARARAHLTHYNEPFAHLFSDLLHRLTNRLRALGYYAPRGDGEA